MCLYAGIIKESDAIQPSFLCIFCFSQKVIKICLLFDYLLKFEAANPVVCGFRDRGRGIPAGGFAAFQAALLKNDPLDHSSRLRRRSGSNPFISTKKDAYQAPFFVLTGEEGFEPP